MSIILYPPSSPILVNILNLPVRYYGVIMSISFLVGIFFVYNLFKFANKKDDAEIFIDYSPILILCSLIGARLFYVLGSLSFYKACQAYAAIHGRSFVTPEDVKTMALPVFRKRIILKTDSILKGYTEENLVKELLDSVPIPNFKAHV